MLSTGNAGLSGPTMTFSHASCCKLQVREWTSSQGEERRRERESKEGRREGTEGDREHEKKADKTSYVFAADGANCT